MGPKVPEGLRVKVILSAKMKGRAKKLATLLGRPFAKPWTSWMKVKSETRDLILTAIFGLMALFGFTVTAFDRLGWLHESVGIVALCPATLVFGFILYLLIYLVLGWANTHRW